MWMFLCAFLALASETDNFSHRQGPVQNDVVNSFIQAKLQQQIVDVHNSKNKNPSDCDRNLVDDLMVEHFDKNSSEVDNIAYRVKAGPDYNKSVWRESLPFPGEEFYSPAMMLKLDGGNFSIGLDKMNHFFSHGYLYWKMVNENPALPKDSVIQALKSGVAQENGVFGLKTTGVKSYGDMSTNYAGLQFWRDLWNGKPPYFTCKDGKLKVTRQFKIEDYLNASSDEAINCNSYDSNSLAKKIIGRTVILKNKCPVNKSVCQDLVKKTDSEFREYLLHPLCLGKDHNQVEVPGNKTMKDYIDTITAAGSGATNAAAKFMGKDLNAELKEPTKGPLQFKPESAGAK
jgi:hypothetical protein